MHVWYLTYLERAKVNGACKATWLEAESGINNAWWSTIGGLLTYPEQQPRATWWVFESYAQLRGQMVNTEGDRTVAGLAAVDAQSRKLRILLGRSGWGTKRNAVRVRNWKEIPWLGNAQSLRVRTRHLPESGWKALAEPAWDEFLVRKPGDSLELNFDFLRMREALLIEISPAA
jgi:hypothetical protein